MAFLTKEECVRRHRLLWNYIANKILEQEGCLWSIKRKRLNILDGITEIYLITVGHVTIAK